MWDFYRELYELPENKRDKWSVADIATWYEENQGGRFAFGPKVHSQDEAVEACRSF